MTVWKRRNDMMRKVFARRQTVTKVVCVHSALLDIGRSPGTEWSQGSSRGIGDGADTWSDRVDIGIGQPISILEKGYRERDYRHQYIVISTIV